MSLLLQDRVYTMQSTTAKREPDCIFCLACEGGCPPVAIKIFKKQT